MDPNCMLVGFFFDLKYGERYNYLCFVESSLYVTDLMSAVWERDFHARQANY